MNPLPTCRPRDIDSQDRRHQWLVRSLWAQQAVGIVGGEPKCYKSFLALDVAVSVASGAPCLRRFPVENSGPVLLFAAEDALPVVKQRLLGISTAADVDFQSLDIHVITSPSLRLDLERDLDRLRKTVDVIRPVLLILDPFVRLHRIDENAAADVAPLLAALRHLQRAFGTAVLLVHHARKSGAARPGQALRGSSELHAWGDSNLYLRRTRDRLLLSVEQRAAPSISALTLELHQDGDALALRVLPDAEHSAASVPAPKLTPAQRIEQALSDGALMSRRQLRDACRIRNATLTETLSQLLAAGRVVETSAGLRLASPLPR
ncbi:MAG: AAA family ATPase [bacterium]|nr:AAA family ATPase [bacterium]